MIPNIKKNDIFWEGNIQLNHWNKIYEENLNIILNIGGDCIVEDVTKVHEEGYNLILSNEVEILNMVFEAIFKEYSKWQDEYDYDLNERSEFMPDLNDCSELKKLIYPEKIFILNVEKEGIPYIGIQFKCTWDEEQGVGIMFHKNSIVDLGSSDTAFMTWIAEEDKVK